MQLSSLVEAIDDDDIDTMRLFLNQGVTMSPSEHFGIYPPIYAVMMGRVGVVREFLQRGIRMDLQAKDGSYPIHTACRNGHLEIVQLLLGIDHTLSEFQNVDGDPICPVRIDDLENVKVCEEYIVICNSESLKQLDIEDSEGKTPLFHACESNQTEIICFLLRMGANVHCVDKQHRSLLFYTVDYSPVMTRMLLMGGIDIHLCDSNNEDIVSYCTKRNLVDSIATIFEYFDGGKYNPSNGVINPFILAVIKGFSKIVEIMLKNGFKPESKALSRSKQDRILLSDNALHAACRGGHLQLVKKIINHVKQPYNNPSTGKFSVTPQSQRALSRVINAQNELLNTPLITACSGGHSDIVDFLVKNGARVGSENKDGKDAFYYACVGDYGKIALTLGKTGRVDIYKLYDGVNLYEKACHLQCISSMDAVYQLKKIQRNTSQNTSTVTSNNSTSTVISNNSTSTTLINDNPSNPSTVESDTSTSMSSNTNNTTPTLDILHPNYIYPTGCTLLHDAIALGHTNSVITLLKHGADPGLVCGKEIPANALHVASEMGRVPELIVLLNCTQFSPISSVTFHYQSILQSILDYVSSLKQYIGDISDTNDSSDTCSFLDINLIPSVPSIPSIFPLNNQLSLDYDTTDTTFDCNKNRNIRLLDTPDSEGYSPLLKSLMNYNDLCAATLLCYGAGVGVEHCDSEGNSPLFYSVREGFIDISLGIVKMVFEQGGQEAVQKLLNHKNRFNEDLSQYTYKYIQQHKTDSNNSDDSDLKMNNKIIKLLNRIKLKLTYNTKSITSDRVDKQ